MNTTMLIIICFNLLLLYVHIKCTPFFLNYWKRADWRKKNYQGQAVYIAYGLILVIHIKCTFMMLYALSLIGIVPSITPKLLLLLIPLMIMALAGWIDDFFGDEEIKGLKGHLKALKNKRFTSGMLKLICGVLCSISIAFLYANSVVQLLLFSLIIMLSIHNVNLFDVRPSRCFKFFFVNALVITFFATQALWTQQMLPVLFSCLPIFALDKNRMVMLGDTGSNVLGLILGLWIIQVAQPQVHYVYLIAFIFLTIMAEKLSFTQYIQKRPLLSKLDQWGVRRSKG